MSIIISNSKPSEFLTPPSALFTVLTADTDNFSKRTAVGTEPAALNFNLQIPDYSIIEEFANYSDFKISYIQTGDDFISLSGFQNGDPATPGPMGITFAYPKYAQLPVGDYECQIEIRITAKNQNGEYELIDSYDIDPILGVDATNLQFTPDEIVLVHLKDSAPLETADIQITCPGDWSLLNSDEENLSSLTVDGSREQHIYYTGNKTISIGLSVDVNELEPGIYRFSIWFYAPTTQGAATVWVVIKPTDLPGDVLVTPEELFFTMIKNQADADYQNVFVHSPTALEFYSLDPKFDGEISYVETPGSNFYFWKIKPKPASNFEGGEYLGFLGLSFDGEDYFVTLHLTVLADYDKDYNKDFHFTKDNEILKLYSDTQQDSYMRLTGEIKTYDNAGNVRVFTREWSLAFVDGVAEINLGRELDGYINFINKSEDQILLSFGSYGKMRLLYRPLSIKIIAREILYEDEQIQNMFFLPYQYFLKGRKPVNQWLTHWQKDAIRVTSKSVVQLNVLKLKGEEEKMKVFRNGSLVTEIAPEVNHLAFQPRFLSLPFFFNTLSGLEPGEKITFSYAKTSRDFIVLPDGPQSLIVGWVSPFEVIETFEFTGAHSLPVNYNETTNEVFVDWVQVLKKVNSSHKQSFKINTGWIFKNNVKILDELMMSKRAFIYHSGSLLSSIDWQGSALNVVPVAKSVVAFDSEQSLYQFEVEFVINHRNEDLIYMR